MSRKQPFCMKKPPKSHNRNKEPDESPSSAHGESTGAQKSLIACCAVCRSTHAMLATACKAVHLDQIGRFLRQPRFADLRNSSRPPWRAPPARCLNQFRKLVFLYRTSAHGFPTAVLYKVSGRLERREEVLLSSRTPLVLTGKRRMEGVIQQHHESSYPTPPRRKTHGAFLIDVKSSKRCALALQCSEALASPRDSTGRVARKRGLKLRMWGTVGGQDEGIACLRPCQWTNSHWTISQSGKTMVIFFVDASGATAWYGPLRTLTGVTFPRNFAMCSKQNYTGICILHVSGNYRRSALRVMSALLELTSRMTTVKVT
jgi:hypothetical protein